MLLFKRSKISFFFHIEVSFLLLLIILLIFLNSSLKCFQYSLFSDTLLTHFFLLFLSLLRNRLTYLLTIGMLILDLAALHLRKPHENPPVQYLLYIQLYIPHSRILETSAPICSLSPHVLCRSCGYLMADYYYAGNVLSKLCSRGPFYRQHVTEVYTGVTDFFCQGVTKAL
jgi:hypothetical protein